MMVYQVRREQRFVLMVAWVFWLSGALHKTASCKSVSE